MALEGRPPCRRIPSRRNAFSYSADSGCSEITANNLAVSVLIFENTDALIKAVFHVMKLDPPEIQSRLSLYTVQTFIQ